MFFAKARRRKAIEERVKRMILSGINCAEFNDLYFEAARQFSIETGAQNPDRDASSTHIQIGGKLYYAIFTRSLSGGTFVHLREE
jgi:hypothetical protein